MTTAPEFINVDAQQIVSEVKTTFESYLGKVIQPSQPEALLVNAIAYRELLLRQRIQAVAESMLLSFSTAPALDYLAELVGVTRLTASFATCDVLFTLSANTSGVVIPVNTRIGTTDGKYFFTVQENINIAAGTLTATATLYANTPGTEANGYPPGEVSVILDPLPFLASAANTNTTETGNNEETDEELKERTRLAPGQFSVAGPTDAYKFFAKSASPTIIDVAVTNPVPGTVEVFPLVSGGVVTPPSILTAVLATLTDEKIRPLTDTVLATSPTIQNYTIDVGVVAYTNADTVQLQADILAALNTYKDNKSAALGQDIKIDQIIALAAADVSQVFDVTVNAPATDLVIAATEVAVCTSVTVTITGTTDG